MNRVNNIIEAQELSKRYGELTAVNQASFNVRQGEIFGFLGPNGAGKTTTINMLCTLTRISSGRASINGHDVAKSPGKVRKSIGLVFQEPSLDEKLTGLENLRFHALLYDLTRNTFQKRQAEVLRMVDLYERRNDQVKAYSGGMRRRLEIARGLLHYPRVLFLDEPTIGLDPQTRRYIWDYIKKLREREEITIFLTTHYMEEAEVCQRVAIMDQGEIIALDEVDALKETVGGDVISIKTTAVDDAARRLDEAFNLTPRQMEEEWLSVEVQNGEGFIPDLMTALNEGKSSLEVESVQLRRPTLEDVFIQKTGRALREEDPDTGKEHMRQRRKLRTGKTK
jgi:ABC-2 type transport system ATP-binding protein